MAMKKCKQSGESQMLSWLPDGDYPGAVVCIGCSGGILVRKGSVVKAVSQAGFDGFAGVVRTHYFDKKTDTITYRKPRKNG